MTRILVAMEREAESLGLPCELTGMGVILFIALSVFFTVALVVASKDTSDMNTRLDDEDQLRYLEEWARKKKRRSK